MKILILSSARSGSNYLSKILHFGLNGTLLLEPFSDAYMETYNNKSVKFVIDVCSINTDLILKTHLTQLNRIENIDQRNYFLKNDNWYKILLLRKNVFACAMSYTIATTLNNFNDKHYNSVNLTLDTNIFLKNVNRNIKHWERISDIKKENNYNKIIYFENFNFNFQKDISLIGLKIKKRNLDVNLLDTKTPTEKIRIDNNDELYTLFLETIKNYRYDGIINNNGIFELL